MKYACTKDTQGEHAKWALTPWYLKGMREFNTVDQIPEGYTLVVSHFAPWWSPLKEWIAANRPWIEIEYGYWGPDTPRRETRRVTYCGHHNMNMRPVPYQRSHLFPSPAQNPWRITQGEYALAILPVETVLQERTGLTLEQFKENIEKQIQPYWSGPIKWRRKVGAKLNRFQSFQEQLEKAHFVVGERTMACAESCLLGVPAYTIDNSVTTLLMGDIKNIATLRYPDRTAWWEHICWSQFNRTEFDSTIPADLVEYYQMPTINGV